MPATIPSHYVYPIYTVILALILIALVPRKEIKELLIFGITFGAVLDVTIIAAVSKLLELGGHLNFEPFGAFGFPFFPPIAWAIWFILFFYFLPTELPWLILYVLTAAAMAVMFSNVLLNLKVFTWNYGRVIVPFLVYAPWFFFSAWAFRRLTQNK
ncbi:MAG: hypothetical protein GX922_04410 [Firmicutes bacterium]|nr:hypothetical protein [Bacillota bacterium]